MSASKHVADTVTSLSWSGADDDDNSMVSPTADIDGVCISNLDHTMLTDAITKISGTHLSAVHSWNPYPTLYRLKFELLYRSSARYTYEQFRF